MNKNILKWGGLLLIIPFITACSDEEDSLAGTPDFTFNSVTGEYKVKINREVKLSASVSNAINAFYTWKQDGEVVSTDTVYSFHGNVLGEHFVNFRVDANNGSVEKQAKVTVVDRLAPKIKVADAAVTYCYKDITLAAETDYTDNTTTFEWLYDGHVVCTDSLYTFNGGANIDVKTVALKVTNADGQDVKNITVSVIPEEEPVLFFDNGSFVLPSQLKAKEVRTMTCPIGRHLVLAPVDFGISDDATYTWKVDGAVQSGQTSVYLDFTPTEEGKIYEVEVTANDNGKTASTTVKVHCTPEEGTYKRPVTALSSKISNTCFDWIQGPGQHVRVSKGQTREQVRQQIQKTLDNGGGGSGYIASLGGCGGYIVFGFDHTITDDGNGEADFDIVGNPLGPNWCECGVVWVSQDDNGNGMPDDTWYELKGSNISLLDGKERTFTKRYALKYYRPTQEQQAILSINNDGDLNFINRNAYQLTAGYFPWFMEEEYYILTGTLLGNDFTTTGLESNWGFEWGYVDNVNNPTGFRIENAIQQDGTPANLKYVDFVKVQTAQLGQGAAVGDVDTETSAATDLRL